MAAHQVHATNESFWCLSMHNKVVSSRAAYHNYRAELKAVGQTHKRGASMMWESMEVLSALPLRIVSEENGKGVHASCTQLITFRETPESLVRSVHLVRSHATCKNCCAMVVQSSCATLPAARRSRADVFSMSLLRNTLHYASCCMARFSTSTRHLNRSGML
jgi:hypothetical protein